MSGGVESERDRELGSRRSGLGRLASGRSGLGRLTSGRSGLGLLGWASWVNTGWLDDWVGVGGGVERPEALLVLEKIFMLGGVELGEERKMPVKLRRRGDLGEEF